MSNQRNYSKGLAGVVASAVPLVAYKTKEDACIQFVAFEVRALEFLQYANDPIKGDQAEPWVPIAGISLLSWVYFVYRQLIAADLAMKCFAPADESVTDMNQEEATGEEDQSELDNEKS